MKTMTDEEFDDLTKDTFWYFTPENRPSHEEFRKTLRAEYEKAEEIIAELAKREKDHD
jgi:hypothetical protein